MDLAPIALFVYNRPFHTLRTVESLLNNQYADQSDLLIYADGPKKDEAISEIRKVREYIQTISGFKSVTITERPQNLGLANSIISGVSEVIHVYGKIIVLEDDLELSPDFLRFMNESLNKYDEYDRVMQISGHMFNLDIEAETDAVFLPFINSIGWATWERAWKFFDPALTGFTQLKSNRSLQKQFNLNGAYDYFGLLESHIKGKVESWAIQWYLSVFMAKGIVLYPARSLIRHIGFGTHATNCRNSEPNSMYALSCSTLPKQDIKFPDVSINKRVYKDIERFLSSHRTSFKIFKSFLKKWVMNN